MLNPTGVIRNEIDENFLKVAVLSRSTKGTMISPFLRAPCSQFSIRCSTRCSQKFHKIHRKTTQACDFIKKEQARNQRGEEGGLPCPFSKNRKKYRILEKHALIAVIYRLNFSFTMQFLRVFRRKSRRFIPAELFFLVLYIISYQSALILKKLPCPKKFRVMRRETQMFSCKFYEISKNTFFTEHLCRTASEYFSKLL